MRELSRGKELHELSIQPLITIKKELAKTERKEEGREGKKKISHFFLPPANVYPPTSITTNNSSQSIPAFQFSFTINRARV